MRKFLAILFFAMLLNPVIAGAQLSPEDSGLKETGNAVFGSDPDSIGEWLGSRIIGPAFSLVASIFLILVIYSGFLWMTSAGNTEQVAKAKRILVAAILGVVIIAGSYAITTVLFDALSESDLSP